MKVQAKFERILKNVYRRERSRWYAECGAPLCEASEDHVETLLRFITKVRKELRKK